MDSKAKAVAMLRRYISAIEDDGFDVVKLEMTTTVGEVTSMSLDGLTFDPPIQTLEISVQRPKKKGP